MNLASQTACRAVNYGASSGMASQEQLGKNVRETREPKRDLEEPNAW
jgi:hypothetical protein